MAPASKASKAEKRLARRQLGPYGALQARPSKRAVAQANAAAAMASSLAVNLPVQSSAAAQESAAGNTKAITDTCIVVDWSRMEQRLYAHLQACEAAAETARCAHKTLYSLLLQQLEHTTAALLAMVERHIQDAYPTLQIQYRRKHIIGSDLLGRNTVLMETLQNLGYTVGILYRAKTSKDGLTVHEEWGVAESLLNSCRSYLLDCSAIRADDKQVLLAIVSADSRNAVCDDEGWPGIVKEAIEDGVPVYMATWNNVRPARWETISAKSPHLTVGYLEHGVQGIVPLCNVCPMSPHQPVATCFETQLPSRLLLNSEPFSNGTIYTCIVVDWSNISIGLRKTLGRRSSQSCGCQHAAAELLKDIDRALCILLSELEQYLAWSFPAFTVSVQERYLVGNEELALNGRKEALQAIGYRVDWLKRADVVVSEGYKSFKEEQGVDESLLNRCRRFIRRAPEIRLANATPLLVYLSADMSNTPCDPSGFPGVAAQAKRHNVLVQLASWKDSQGREWEKVHKAAKGNILRAALDDYLSKQRCSACNNQMLRTWHGWRSAAPSPEPEIKG